MPIPAGYHEPLKTPRAARTVEAAWTYEAQDTGQSLILPDGRCDVIILREVGSAPTAFITGPATRPYTVTQNRGDQWVGLRLRPGFGAHLWGTKFAQATDDVLSGAEALDVMPDLAPLLNPSLSIDAICTGLLDLPQIQTATTCPVAVITALDGIHLSSGRMRLAALAHLCGCTSRHLNRLFQHHIGMPAKTYAQLVRVHRAIAHLRAGHLTLTQTALEAGFADHAHMTRDMRTFGGLVPSALPPNLVQPDFLG